MSILPERDDIFKKYIFDDLKDLMLIQPKSVFANCTYNHYASQGIVIKRVLTDNGSGRKSKKLADACDTLNLKHIFT